MPTITDIANACGTSKATVSKILNNNDGKISLATRSRVLEAVQRMDYQPNSMARGLSNRRSSSIGVCTPKVPHLMSHEYYTTIIDGIVEESANLGQSVTLFNSLIYRKDDPGKLIFGDGRCDGLIVIGLTGTELLGAIQRANIPSVVLHGGVLPRGQQSIDIDNHRAGYDLTRYLVSLGHRRIAFLHGAVGAYFSEERFKGYRQAMLEAGLPFDDRLELRGRTGDMSEPHPAQVAAANLELGMTALVCDTDHVALGAIHALRDAGVSVPVDVSVAGIDGSLAGQASYPTLTTINQSLEKLGAEATRILLSRIEQSDLPAEHAIWPTELIVRKSVAPPASRV